MLELIAFLILLPLIFLWNVFAGILFLITLGKIDLLFIPK